MVCEWIFFGVWDDNVCLFVDLGFEMFVLFIWNLNGKLIYYKRDVGFKCKYIYIIFCYLLLFFVKLIEII